MAVQRQVLRLDLTNVEKSLLRVEQSWESIDAALNQRGIGGKLPFSRVLRGRMMTAYELLDSMLENTLRLFESELCSS